MGTSRNATELVGKLTELGDALPVRVAKGVARSGLIVEAAVAAAAGRYALSPLARTLTVVNNVAAPQALVAMMNPKAHLLDHDTKPHGILPGAVTGRRGRKQALVTPEGPRASAHVKGTRGKFMWERGVDVARPLIVEQLGQAVGDTIISVFGL